jgi:hypothetical protein
MRNHLPTAALIAATLTVGAMFGLAISNDPPQDPTMCHADGWCVTECGGPTGFLAQAEDDPCWGYTEPAWFTSNPAWPEGDWVCQAPAGAENLCTDPWE